jgi:hypothetical protein
MDSSALVCNWSKAMAIGREEVYKRGEKAIYVWALETKGSSRALEANSGCFFKLASFPGRCGSGKDARPWLSALGEWSCGQRALASGKTSRVSAGVTVLSPCCLSDELPKLIELLIAQGSTERTRFRRLLLPKSLNEQLRHHEANSLSLNSFVPPWCIWVQGAA